LIWPIDLKKGYKKDASYSPNLGFSAEMPAYNQFGPSKRHCFIYLLVFDHLQ